MNALSALLYAVLIGAAPVVFFLWFFYKRDKWEPEPLRLVLTVFVLGLIAAYFLSLIIELTVSLFISAALVIVVAAPIVEESLKWSVVRLRAYNRKEFNEPLDGLVYGAAAALGLAATENVFSYLLPALLAGGFSTDFLIEAVIRGVFSVPGHALYTGISCFFLGVAKFMPKGARRYGFVVGGLVLAIVLHMTWNGMGVLFADVFGLPLVWLVAAVVFAAVCWLLVANWINNGLNRSPFNPTRRTPLPSAVVGARVSKVIPPADFTTPPRTQSAARSAAARFCPRCGTPLAGVVRFCPTCGTPIRAWSG